MFDYNGIFVVGLIVGGLVYIFSALTIGRKAAALHYLLTGFMAVVAFMAWNVGDRLSDPVRTFCGGFWILITVCFLLRFGAAMLPGKEPKRVRYVK